MLVYDGDCAFCQSIVDRSSRRTGEALTYLSYQRIGERFPEIPRELFETTVVRVSPDGSWTSGGQAAMLTLADGGIRWPHALYRRVPGVAPVVELGYRLVSRNRHRISRLTRRRCGLDRDPPAGTGAPP